MTVTAPIPVVSDLVADAPLPLVHGVGQRQRRRHERRRRVRQQVLVVVVLAAVFAVTVALLATEWLNSGTPRASAGLGQTLGRSLS